MILELWKKLHVEFSSDYDSSPNQRCLGQRSVLTQRCPGQQGINKPKRKLLRDFAKVENLYVQWVKMTVSRAKFFFYLQNKRLLYSSIIACTLQITDRSEKCHLCKCKIRHLFTNGFLYMTNYIYTTVYVYLRSS